MHCRWHNIVLIHAGWLIDTLMYQVNFEKLVAEQEAKVHAEREQQLKLLELQKQSLVAAHTAKEELVR